ncbi:MAG TPA: hypothetical protein EYF98_11810 [Planctomycetes bacterium]|nr:hypothetical protein [Planctomycetota bacterium]
MPEPTVSFPAGSGQLILISDVALEGAQKTICALVERTCVCAETIGAATTASAETRYEAQKLHEIQMQKLLNAHEIAIAAMGNAHEIALIKLRQDN